MNLRHTAALALVGWYLMLPPNACEESSTCNGKSIFWNAVASLRGQSDSWAVWRNSLQDRVAIDAPLSEWHQLSEFETLKECHAEAVWNSATPIDTDQEKRNLEDVKRARLELKDEGHEKPSTEEVGVRAAMIRGFLNAQAGAARCIASDDPRLKGD
jgi:hypothetical protein